MEQFSDEIDKNTHTNSTSPQGQRRLIIGVTIVLIIFLSILIGSVYGLLLPTTDTARVRDIFIIFMALESLVLGLVLVLLIIQLARLINLLQNEIKPILESTNDTANNLRGTTKFLSDNLVEPIMKLNEYLAGFQQVFRVVGLGRGRQKNNK